MNAPNNTPGQTLLAIERDLMEEEKVLKEIGGFSHKVIRGILFTIMEILLLLSGIILIGVAFMLDSTLISVPIAQSHAVHGRVTVDYDEWTTFILAVKFLLIFLGVCLIVIAFLQGSGRKACVRLYKARSYMLADYNRKKQNRDQLLRSMAGGSGTV
jgi:hypothetical protein